MCDWSVASLHFSPCKERQRDECHVSFEHLDRISWLLLISFQREGDVFSRSITGSRFGLTGLAVGSSSFRSSYKISSTPARIKLLSEDRSAGSHKKILATVLHEQVTYFKKDMRCYSNLVTRISLSMRGGYALRAPPKEKALLYKARIGKEIVQKKEIFVKKAKRRNEMVLP